MGVAPPCRSSAARAALLRFHAQERYPFRLADQVVELDIGATQERLSPRLIVQRKQLPESVRQHDEASKSVFIEALTQVMVRMKEQGLEESVT